jgi:hypothetical protein
MIFNKFIEKIPKRYNVEIFSKDRFDDEFSNIIEKAPLCKYEDLRK